jgi:superfamily II DNA/RNA helicase
LRLLILDEADEMAPQSFQEQLAEIFRRLPESVQVAVFSTAKADDVLAVAERVMHSPTRIVIERDELALGRTKHFYVAVENSDKIETLCDIYESVSICQSIIFVNSRAMVESVGAQLSAYGHVASSLHGDMAMDDRRRVVADFLAGRSRVVVTTDLMARGLDSMSQFIGCVVNFELPAKTNDYLRRSCGRDSSPRYGRKAVVISFVSQRDMSRLREIESHLSITIDGLPMNLAHVLSDW